MTSSVRVTTTMNTGVSGRSSGRPRSRLPNAVKNHLVKDKPEELAHECQELLKRLLITLSKGERSIERQRQVLAQLNRFEPHAAFQRIDRDQDSKVSSIEILRFLRDNGVEEATEADTHYIVKYFDSNNDDLLEYEDLMQMVMPCDDQYLRAAIAQRDIYEVTKHDFLDAEIEAELTRLFEKEIALNRVCEELKQELDATKSFCVKKAFAAIDDWQYGFIDKKNLKSFLRKHNYIASTAECMAIIRRLDLDADARLSKQEFADGLRPEEPYSRALKRDQMKRGSSANRISSRNMRPAATVRSGQLLMLKGSQKDEVRTLAIDRQHTSQRKGLQVGTTPLKSRPVLVQDLSLFNSQKPGTGRSRQLNNKPQQPQRSYPGVEYFNAADQSQPLVSSRSNRSRKSSRSVRKSETFDMKRHANSVVGNLRKKDQRPLKPKKLKKSRSRKSLKRQGSMDDVLIDRLAKPVDHTKLKKKLEREQREEFERSKPQMPTRSRSRSVKKPRKSSRSLCREYKSFVRKINDTRNDSEDENNWRGTNDFTKLSASLHTETQDDNARQASNKKRSRKRSSRKEKHDKSPGGLSMSNFKDVPPRVFLQSRDQAVTPKDYNKIIADQLSSIKKELREKTPQDRQPVYSKHREITSPKNILPRTEEAFFLRSLQEIIMFEKDLEVQKINLSLRDDFNLIDAYGILDEDGKGNLNPQELHVALRRLEIPATQEDCYLLFLRFNRDVDGLLKYSEFTSAFMPVDQHYARQLGSKRLQYCHPPSRTSFCYETMRHYCEVWQLMVKIEQSVEQIKNKLTNRPAFDIDCAFRSLDQSFSGSITYTDIKNLMVEYGLHTSAEDLQLLVYRLDKDKDAKVSFLEFKQGLTPQRHYLYNTGSPERPLSDNELRAKF